MRPARILVMRGGAVGDFIVTLPALAALRGRWPDSHIEIIGYPHVAALAGRAGLANRVRSLHDAGLARYFAWNAPLRDEDQAYFASFDIVVNYLHDPEAILADNLKRCGVGILLTASPLVTGCHAVDHFLKPLESLAIYDAPSVPDLRWPGMGHGEETLSGKPRLVIHPGSGGKSKNWPLPRFVEVARSLQSMHNLDPVFLTGDAETEYMPGLDRALEGFTRRHNLDLVDLAGILAGARLFIGNDSGISHLAAAVGCPCLVLFGPSDPALWSPRGRRVRVVRSPTSDMADLAMDSIRFEAEAMLAGT